MGINIGGFTIDGFTGSQAMKIAGASPAYTVDTTGRTYYPNQIGFIAGYNVDPGWIAWPTATWTKQTYFNNTVYNKGGGYSAGRFTVPVAGAYLFHYTIYVNKPTAAQGSHIYSNFFINGGQTNSAIRLKGHFQPVNYSFVNEDVDILYLNVGDYVEAYNYANVAGISFYPYYSEFAGMLVG